jgi:NAD(P)H-hydrate epimerase
MQPVVSADEMRWCDRTTIETYGIAGMLLMENAGRSVAEVMQREYGRLQGKTVYIFCGKGNNGGDGFVIARSLHSIGAMTTVFLLPSARQLSGDAKSNYLIVRRLARSSDSTLRIEEFSSRRLTNIPSPDFIIDAIFGTGFAGRVEGKYRDAVEWINRQRVPVVSVDIPSGVNGTNGAVETLAVYAHHTVTFGLIKTGLLVGQGQDYSGNVHLVDIGIPPAVSRSPRLRTFLVEREDVRRCLPGRASTVHKYAVGKVFILAGSRGYTGAAALCAEATLRSGAGAVILGTPEAVYPILARKLSEPIVTPLPSTDEGTMSLGALPGIREKIRWADVVVIGPGLSSNAETRALVRSLLLETPANYVVDADALRAVAEIGLRRLARTKSEWILTPHTGELGRIVKMSADQIEQERISWARKIARAGRCTLILKGGPTVTGVLEGKVLINSTGNPGMATVGSGDVLAGLIGGLWAQGMKGDDAAFSGVYLHGLAGDLAADRFGVRSIVAGDILDCLSASLRRVEKGGEV